jgi:hypothetical protein
MSRCVWCEAGGDNCPQHPMTGNEPEIYWKSRALAAEERVKELEVAANAVLDAWPDYGSSDRGTTSFFHAKANLRRVTKGEP